MKEFRPGLLGTRRKRPARQFFRRVPRPGAGTASTIFGISTAVLGYAFYFGLATLAFAKTILSLRLAKLANDVAEIVVSVCFLYVLYLLFFQAVIAKAFCPLCLVSAAITIALFAVHVVQWKHGGFVPIQIPSE